MAYLLRFDGGERVETTATIALSNAEGFKITVDALFSGMSSGFLPIIGKTGGSTQRIMFYGTSASNINGIRVGGSTNSAIPSFDWTTRKSVAIESTATTLKILIDGSLHAEIARTVSFVSLDEIFAGNTILAAPSDLYGYQIEIGGALVHNYDPTVSGGAGTTLTDIQSANNGTLIGFTVPDCWVFYDDGGVVTSTIATTWPQLSIEANQTATIPATDSVIAFNWPQLSVSASQSAIAPVSTSAAFNWPQLSVSANQSSAAPQFDSDVYFTWPQLTVSAEQSTSYSGNVINFAWPQLSLLANQSATVPGLNTAVIFTWPQLSVGVNQVTPAENPEYNFPISSYGNNNQWRFSPFFKQTK